MRIISTLLLACFLLAAPLTSLADNNPNVLKKKIMFDQKKLVVMENLELTDQEATAFWPVFTQFQEEQFMINQQAARLIVAYASAYQTLTDDQAAKIVEEYFNIREARTATLKKYMQKFSKVLPGKKLFRFLQIENKLEAIARAELAKRIPLAQ